MSLPNHAAEVKARLTDVHHLCAELGLLEGHKPARQARGLLVCCPAHGDRTPSCSVTLGPDGTIRVKCHGGGCELAGDALALIAAVHRLDPRRDHPKILAIGAAIAGLTLDVGGGRRSPAPAGLRAQPAHPPPAAPAPAPLDAETFALVVEDLLRLCPLDEANPDARPVVAYLLGRGLLAEAVAEGWGALPPPARQPPVLGALVERHGADVIARSGLALPRSKAPPFRFLYDTHALLVPYRAPDSGRIEVLQRRRLTAEEPRYVMTRRPSMPYGIDQREEGIPVAFVEGALDVLALRQQAERKGHPLLVLGVPGLAHWRPTWAELGRGRQVFLAFDADEAGDAKAKELAPSLLAAGALAVQRLRPKGKDWAAANGGGSRKVVPIRGGGTV